MHDLPESNDPEIRSNWKNIERLSVAKILSMSNPPHNKLEMDKKWVIFMHTKFTVFVGEIGN